MGYPQTNRKIDTGKTLTRWPVFVDHFSIGVICSSVSYELFPNVHENGGIGYQFLYEGDELKCYEHGLLIESVE